MLDVRAGDQAQKSQGAGKDARKDHVGGRLETRAIPIRMTVRCHDKSGNRIQENRSVVTMLVQPQQVQTQARFEDFGSESGLDFVLWHESKQHEDSDKRGQWPWNGRKIDLAFLKSAKRGQGLQFEGGANPLFIEAMLLENPGQAGEFAWRANPQWHLRLHDTLAGRRRFVWIGAGDYLYLGD